MISLARILKLRDLEIFQVIRDGRVLAYSIIEDTRNPFTEEDKKLDPLCFMDEEDINEILNVFRIALISDKKLSKADSITLRTFFSEFVNNTHLTNFIIQEYVQKDLYEEEEVLSNTE